MTRHKVLVDLRVALNSGYCGIGQDSALIFHSLSMQDQTDVNGLLYLGAALDLSRKYRKTTNRLDNLEQTNHFFHDIFHNEKLTALKALLRLRFKKFLPLLKRKFELYPIDELCLDVIWRNIFGKYLNPENRQTIQSLRYYFTDLTEQHLKFSELLKRPLTLDTSAYDFIIFPHLQTTHVSPNTLKLVRYHDAIPLTNPDFTLASSTLQHARQLIQCKDNTYFVCNSEPTRTELVNLIPELENKSTVIPTATAYDYKKVNNRAILNQILAVRLSDHILKGAKLKEAHNNLLKNEPFDYILNVATLDPKKNIALLVTAWEKLTYKHDNKLKLIILANKGWLSQEAEEAMRPHLETGDIIHITSATPFEMEYIYSHAKAFAFPSLVEGFGIPPLEALLCECPTVVSDIPVHRWVMDDAVLYCNPHDSDSLADVLERLLYSEESPALCRQLAKQGLVRASRYSHTSLSQQWQTLLDTLKSTQQR